MSEILVDNLTGKTAAGSIVVYGEGGTATTNLQQGLAKGWMKYDQHNDIVDDSVNVSSATDTTTGKFKQNHTNSMSNANYSTNCTTGQFRVFCTTGESDAGAGDVDTTAIAFFQSVYNSSGSTYTYIDMASNGTVIHGDLA